jgi:phage terminase small subunit
MPPAHITLDECDQPFWKNVVAEFARAEWTDHQLELAAMLARTMADLAREQVTLRTEGFISVRENGTSVENPRARAVKSLTGDILSLRRSLALHARARSGDTRNDVKRREVGKTIERDLGDDDLLARPTFN